MDIKLRLKITSGQDFRLPLQIKIEFQIQDFNTFDAKTIIIIFVCLHHHYHKNNRIEKNFCRRTDTPYNRGKTVLRECVFKSTYHNNSYFEHFFLQ